MLVDKEAIQTTTALTPSLAGATSTYVEVECNIGKVGVLQGDKEVPAMGRDKSIQRICWGCGRSFSRFSPTGMTERGG